jgi:naphthalene 1,2-dioxygenase system ferredoxin subunit
VYNVGGEFYATDNICTHAQALLSEGWLEAMSLNVLFTVAL